MCCRSSGMSYSLGEVRHQPRRRAVHRLRVPGVRGGQEPLVLQADRLGVDVPVARVPGHVLAPHMLGDMPVGGAQRVVPGHVGGVLDQVEDGVPGALGVMDDDVVDRLRGGPVGQVVVAVVVASRRTPRTAPGSTRRTRPRADSGPAGGRGGSPAPRSCRRVRGEAGRRGEGDPLAVVGRARGAAARITSNTSSANAGRRPRCRRRRSSAPPPRTSRPGPRSAAAPAAAGRRPAGPRRPRTLAAASPRSASADSPVSSAARAPACAAGRAARRGSGTVASGTAAGPGECRRARPRVPWPWCGAAASAVRASVRCIGPVAAGDAGRPGCASQRDWRYETPSSTLCGTWY